MKWQLIVGAIGFIVWSIFARALQGIVGAAIASSFGVDDLFMLGWLPYFGVFVVVHGLLGLVFCWLFIRVNNRRVDKD